MNYEFIQLLRNIYKNYIVLFRISIYDRFSKIIVQIFLYEVFYVDELTTKRSSRSKPRKVGPSTVGMYILKNEKKNIHMESTFKTPPYQVTIVECIKCNKT